MKTRSQSLPAGRLLAEPAAAALSRVARRAGEPVAPTRGGRISGAALIAGAAARAISGRTGLGSDTDARVGVAHLTSTIDAGKAVVAAGARAAALPAHAARATTGAVRDVASLYLAD